MAHTAIYGSSNPATEFSFDGVWDAIPFVIDLTLTTDGPLRRKENSEGTGNVTRGKKCVKKLSSKLNLSNLRLLLFCVYQSCFM